MSAVVMSVNAVSTVDTLSRIILCCVHGGGGAVLLKEGCSPSLAPSCDNQKYLQMLLNVL